jgi:hypothetical protein
MPYTDFTIDSVSDLLGIAAEPADLFPGLPPAPVSDWLRETLGQGMNQVLVSEKARSEFIVVPILLAARELTGGRVTIVSGQRLDVDPALGLVGECDFILADMPPLPGLRAPLLTIVEAKKHDIEAGVWQCIAQMVGARIFNERAGKAVDPIHGCVTNGHIWQFLRLSGTVAAIDRTQYYLDNVGGILAVFAAMLGPAPAPTAAAGAA